MRPANFLRIRPGQLAMLIHNSEHLFSKIKETTPVAGVKKMIALEANDYWHYHYTKGFENLKKIFNVLM